MLYFTADAHLGHDNIRRLDGRPFSDVDEMERAYIEVWNTTVTSQDTTYHLGDFFWRNEVAHRVLPQLNGKIICLRGNHDKSWWKPEKLKKFKHVTLATDSIHVVNHTGTPPLVLCHYPMRSWQGSARGSWHLYGHTHRALSAYGKSLCVCWNVQNYSLVSLEQVKEQMNIQPKTEDPYGHI